jgi:hypothetical protein
MLLIGAAFSFLIATAFGADAPAAGAQVAGSTAEWLSGIVVWAAAKYPWAVTVLLAIAGLRIVCKPAFSIWHAIVARTPSPKDDEFLAKVEASTALKWFLWVLDYVASIKIVPVTPVQQKIVAVEAKVQSIAERVTSMASPGSAGQPNV